jgi:hypothetical protein
MQRRNYQTMTECRIMIVLRPNMQPAKVEEMICLGITSIAARFSLASVLTQSGNTIEGIMKYQRGGKVLIWIPQTSKSAGSVGAPRSHGIGKPPTIYEWLVQEGPCAGAGRVIREAGMRLPQESVRSPSDTSRGRLLRCPERVGFYRRARSSSETGTTLRREATPPVKSCAVLEPASRNRECRAIAHDKDFNSDGAVGSYLKNVSLRGQ